MSPLLQKGQRQSLLLRQVALLLSTLLVTFVVAQTPDRDLDQFSYGETVLGDRNNIYGPKDWAKLTCPDIDTCVRNLITICCRQKKNRSCIYSLLLYISSHYRVGNMFPNSWIISIF